MAISFYFRKKYTSYNDKLIRKEVYTMLKTILAIIGGIVLGVILLPVAFVAIMYIVAVIGVFGWLLAPIAVAFIVWAIFKIVHWLFEKL